VRIGRFGPYVVKPGTGTDKSSETINASIPESFAPADLSEEDIVEIIKISELGPQSMGKHPDTGEDIYCLTGRYGPYVQLGEVTEENPKPKRASVPRGKNPSELTMDEAVHLLILPRTLGEHPETKNPILANKGRFGPYIMHDGDFRSLKKDDDVYEVSLERALELLAEEKKGRRGAKVLKEFEVPGQKKKLQLLEGKYGPYLKFGSKNISVPKGEDLEKVDQARALEIADLKKGAAKKKVAKKAAKKKTTKKKARKKTVRKKS